MQELSGSPRISVRRRGKSATGLARPDYFDWRAEAERLVARHAPDHVLVILGGNDGQDLVGDGPRVRWGSAGWAEGYLRRMETFVGRLLDGDGRRRVTWIALPTMARPRLERKLDLIRAVQVRFSEQHPRVGYFELRPWFYEGDERLRERVELGGKAYPLRQEDGIHFSRPGAMWLARQVAPALLERLRASD